MSVSVEEARKEEKRQRKAMTDLEREVIAFLRKKRLASGTYYSVKEIEEIAQEKFRFDRGWLRAYLRKKSMNWIFSSLEEINHEGKAYYRYRHGWLARIFR